MGFCFIASKSGKVIDIQRASKQEVADLDAFQQKSTDNDNQQWEFKPGPAGTPSDVFMISSKLDGSVISISPSGTLVANKKLADQFLWRFVEDPAGSGYCFIQSAFAPNSVIAINGDKNGAPLGLGPIATADNKLWKPRGEKFPSTVSLPSTLNFTGATLRSAHTRRISRYNRMARVTSGDRIPIGAIRSTRRRRRKISELPSSSMTWITCRTSLPTAASYGRRLKRVRSTVGTSRNTPPSALRIGLPSRAETKRVSR
jgi:hypothetical protein